MLNKQKQIDHGLDRGLFVFAKKSQKPLFVGAFLTAMDVHAFSFARCIINTQKR